MYKKSTKKHYEACNIWCHDDVFGFGGGYILEVMLPHSKHISTNESKTLK